jgi:membrane peptidoglycan carboxypeptidase
MAYGAVANDGVLMRPQLVRSVHDPDGKEIFHFRPEAVRRVVDAETARTLRGFMRSVMTEGTGTQAEVSWVEVGGKTGTSEKFADGKYSRSRHYASFVGVAPIEEPELVCFIMLDEPDRTASFGGSAAAPVFREVLEVYGRLPGAALRPEYASMTVSVPSPKGLEKLMPAESVAGAGPGSYPGTVSLEGGIPDVRGESMRRALQVMHAHGVTASVTGTGKVVRQDPLPGSPLGRRVDLYGNQQSPGTAVLASSTEAWKEERKGIPEAGWR